MIEAAMREAQDAVPLAELEAAFAAGLPQLAVAVLDEAFGAWDEQLRTAASRSNGIKGAVSSAMSRGGSADVCVAIHPQWRDKIRGMESSAAKLARRIPWRGSVYKTSEALNDISAFARTGHLTNKQLRKGLKPKSVAALDSYVKAWGPKIGPGKTLYRGMALNDKAAAALKPGAIISDAGYSSATTSRKLAEQFTRGGKRLVLMEIEKGSGATELLDSYLAEAHGGDEFLFPRGTRFEVVRVVEDSVPGITFVKGKIVNKRVDALRVVVRRLL